MQILLPVTDNNGEGFPPGHFEAVREVLTAHFGGLTAYTRAPAEGLWRSDSEKTSRDDIVVLEVMAEVIDRSWWSAYKRELGGRFRQQELTVRVQEIELL